MAKNRQSGRYRLYSLLLLAASLSLAACQTRPPTELPVDVKVSLISSGSSSIEKNMIQALQRRLGDRLDTYELSGKNRSDRRLLVRIKKENPGPIVTVGTKAARLASRLKNQPVYYSQIYRYPAGSKNNSSHIGISVVPDPATVFASLRTLDKSIRRIGVITGPGVNRTVSDIRKAAANQGLSVIHREVKTDRAFLFEARRMAAQVDAYWLLPDDRVLSGTAIRRFMRYTVKQGKQVIAFTPNLLKLGALISVESDEQSAADLINRLMVARHYDEKKYSSKLVYVEKIRTRISKLSADRLGIKIPAEMLPYRYD